MLDERINSRFTLLAVLGFLAIVAAVGLNIIDDQSGVKFSVGSSEVSRRNIDLVTHAIGSTSAATIGRYDGFDAPAGTEFLPSNRGFTSTQIQATADSATDTVISVGFGSSHVEDSLTAPLASFQVAEITLPAGSGFNQIDLALQIPPKRYPWVMTTGPASAPGRVAIEGISK